MGYWVTGLLWRNDAIFKKKLGYHWVTTGLPKIKEVK